ncbi:similar to Saccharomyces cerevisiae YPL129W TAF14 Subunit of TFIID, TFIIF, INO80, SWI/SNF, and NuA3 complexes, involved in RNA polymerase II transcription initiation and in chromatin modification [Maudiozyma barnettii]|uniref:Similar to Saccharomyces cerevisiae YPL129W TAF14 Subunit of TFIID, TFIIF, INO80, SWI/SNF, and NuA3 complexes, involved in RNA polymerase II transcription initiation and in chromatin modification n=1 Tax=Maudiozyma barnettii TaxID=61262 RepID=A0A8H2VCJ3_9SACH|nr:TATA-binding protein-associated factor TAF14 [Kazachstania barnettii]CAB4252738.1 similar to Saccharomyces cerevisiae YPL129W TAF14 Subunit of TFIID, TFIIF, INO80, SWI/SNF, and NuA3 complexes, involved in RNA polymerase II transcription initiation and in chromatin modification [Kazachstania barnettii]CAD1780528.1 similar to Saccharomyces cerevisiae YPL129W TAF14 Subunit of TFIID, TFIIF, INO80, SWI/SNF, and NuA3 complexes, involved in RNA polymerase II transcription initiation and in chromatin 
MVASVKRTVRVKTSQHILPDVPPVENFPVRQWSIEIVLLDENGNEVPATIFEKVIYHLHPTFANPNRTVTEIPFRIEEQGWGGFPMDISVFFLEKAGERKVPHDLNFLQDSYETDHVVQVPLNKPLLLAELEKSGSVEENPTTSAKRKTSLTGTIEPKPKKAKTATVSTMRGNVDLEKLALGLTKLNEDDLVGVVQMISDNNTPEMNVTNNADDGEFIVDLYSLPDGLLKSLSDYVKKNTV